MDIYILHDGKEIGPFSEVTTQTLLKQGSVQLNDPAWRPGMDQWTPLHSVLYPAASGPMQARPPLPQAITEAHPVQMPAPSAVAADAAPPILVPVEKAADHQVAIESAPATEKQKAFLEYMGQPVPSDLTKDRAALAVNDVMEDPRDPARLASWNTDRLRLHPELFAAEIQAKKDSRPSVFLQLVQSEGEEFFSKVTKAHCQVLVGFLDMRFPNWDADKPEDATWKYLFPAIAEKFPLLVTKSAKGKFKFPDGAKVAPELTRNPVRNPVRLPVAGALKPRVVQRPASPMVAVMRGVVIGLVILSAAFLIKEGKGFFPSGGLFSNGIFQTPKDSAVPVGLEPASAVAPGEPTAVAEVAPATSPAESAAAAAPVAAEPVAAEPAAAAEPAVVPLVADPVTALTPISEEPLAPAPVSTQARAWLVVTKQAEVKSPFGKVTLRPGTKLKIVAVEGTNVRVKYGKDDVVIPVASTDVAVPVSPPAAAPEAALGTAPAAAPLGAAPAPADGTAAPAAAASLF